MRYSNLARFVVVSVVLAACEGPGSTPDNPKEISVVEAVRVSDQEDKPAYVKVKGTVRATEVAADSTTLHGYVCNKEEGESVTFQDDCVTCDDWRNRETLAAKAGQKVALSGRLGSASNQTTLADCKVE